MRNGMACDLNHPIVGGFLPGNLQVHSLIPYSAPARLIPWICIFGWMIDSMINRAGWRFEDRSKVNSRLTLRVL